MKGELRKCENVLGGCGLGNPPNSQADTTNLDKVFVDPLGEGFLLHAVPFIWRRQNPFTLSLGEA